MSLTALREIFRDFPSSDLPPDLAECLGGNKAAIKANHDAYRLWELRDNERRIETHFTSSNTVPATPDPVPDPVPPPSLSPHIAPPPTLNPTCLPPHVTYEHACSTQHATTSHPRPMPLDTVHRTDKFSTTAHRTDCLDPSLHLCPHPPPTAEVRYLSAVWDSHVLFPEISAPRPHSAILPTTSTSQKGTTPQATPNPVRLPKATTQATSNPTQTCRTARIKTTKPTPQDPSLLDLEARDFYEIPLQYAEGRELLNLIGAASIQIPPYLIQANPKANAQTGPSTSAQPTLQTTPTYPEAQARSNTQPPLKNLRLEARRPISLDTETVPNEPASSDTAQFEQGQAPQPDQPGPSR